MPPAFLRRPGALPITGKRFPIRGRVGASDGTTSCDRCRARWRRHCGCPSLCDFARAARSRNSCSVPSIAKSARPSPPSQYGGCRSFGDCVHGRDRVILRQSAADCACDQAAASPKTIFSLASTPQSRCARRAHHHGALDDVLESPASLRPGVSEQRLFSIGRRPSERPVSAACNARNALREGVSLRSRRSDLSDHVDAKQIRADASSGDRGIDDWRSHPRCAASGCAIAEQPQQRGLKTCRRLGNSSRNKVPPVARSTYSASTHPGLRLNRLTSKRDQSSGCQQLET